MTRQRKSRRFFPVRVPNLLINGAEGIAVGMSTSIPPHNLGEVIDTVQAYIDNQEMDTASLLEYLHGPDFPQEASSPTRRICLLSTRLELEKLSSGLGWR